MSVTLPLDVCPLFVVNVRHFTFRCLSPLCGKCPSHITFRCLSPLSFKMSVTFDLQMSVPHVFNMSVTFNLQMSVPLLLFIADNPSACRRRNHCMVEEGVHVVPTLRNRVVIFFVLQGYLVYFL